MLICMYTPVREFFYYMNINIFKNNAFLGEKTPLIGSIMAGILVGICLLGIVVPQVTNADFANTKTAASYVAKASNEKKIAKIINATVTAYSSHWSETTGIPGVPGTVTASGKQVSPEIVANNGLPFGTKIKVPALYGDKIFIVGDRMNKRMGSHRFDFWFSTRSEALNFGVKNVEIEVLES